MSAEKEIKALREKAEAIKKETLEFINTAKGFSSKDAKDLVGYAKKNWKAVLGIVAALGIGGALLKRRSSKAKAKAKVAKKKTTKKTKTV
jgi:hypothetical protein